jgi:hypothetical protein
MDKRNVTPEYSKNVKNSMTNYKKFDEMIKNDMRNESLFSPLTNLPIYYDDPESRYKLSRNKDIINKPITPNQIPK